MPKPITYDHLKSRKKPVIKTVFIALDSEIADEDAELHQKMEFAKIRHDANPTDATVLKAYADAQAAYDKVHGDLVKSSVRFRFRSLGRKRFEDLVGKHTPTEKQIAEAKQIDPTAVLDFNSDTFPVALCQACIIEPDLSAEEINDMFDSEDWSANELAALFGAALSANNSRRVIDLGNEFRGTSGSA